MVEEKLLFLATFKQQRAYGCLSYQLIDFCVEMSQPREVLPVLEDSRFGSQHVNVDRTVEALGKALKEGAAALLTRQSEISRAGIVMKRVEEEFKARISSMKTENRSEKKQVDGKEVEFNSSKQQHDSTAILLPK